MTGQAKDTGLLDRRSCLTIIDTAVGVPLVGTR